LGLGLLLAIALVVQVVFFRPFSVDVFFEKVFMEFALKNPELLTSLRILEQFGIESHNGKLTDSSPAHAEGMAKLTRQALEDLHAYDRSGLSEEKQLSYDVLEYFLKITVEGERFDHHDYPVNQLFGVQNELPSFMSTMHQVKNRQDAEYYIERLSQFDAKFSQVLQGLRLREEKQIMPPRLVVEKVLTEMRDFIATPVKENVLHTSFSDRLEKEADVTTAEKDELIRRVGAEISDTVYPAYQELIDYFVAIESIAQTNHGVWNLPDGKNYYAWKVRQHTTTDMAPEEIHQLGLREVARIEAEMNAILAAQGYVDGNVGERMAALGKEPRFLYQDSATDREQVKDDFQVIIDEIDAGLEPYFDLRPASGVEVKSVPSFKEKTAPLAYYSSPSMDASRPGAFYVNLGDMGEIKKWGMNTLAYHEAIPGHHFQMTIAQELEGVPTFRRILPFTAYTEGWALYSERLAKEIGFQDDPFTDLGRLQAEIWRAVRLVVDTGMHEKRWSREQAIDYMVDKTGIDRDGVVIEIERYLVSPGQALAYKIGMEKILALRERARDSLDAQCDIRECNYVVLSNGSLPLFLLEKQVDAYIASHSSVQASENL